MSYPLSIMDTMNETIECPNHNGSFDCNPFCRLCEGNQETDLDTLLTYAYSVSWDGCHKIYLNMDKMQHDKMIEYGYERTIQNNNPYITKQEVQTWYEDSCSLRFIDAVFTNDDETDKFVTVIAQFFGEEDEE
jgi:hypothetical protein